MINKKQIIILLLVATGCSTRLPNNNFSSIQQLSTMKEKVESFIGYIATDEEKAAVKKLEKDEELNSYLVEFWKKRDPDPLTKENEFKEEYVKRFKYANTNLGGWRTDRARVYILYGAPDNILNETMNNMEQNIFSDYEVWVYDRRTLHPEQPNIFAEIEPGKVKFIFANKTRFGTKEQVYSTEENEKIDPDVYNWHSKYQLK